MQNTEDEYRSFEVELKCLMKGYITDYNDLSYILCYLCYANSKLNSSPYNNFNNYNIDNSFESFINAVKLSFSNLDQSDFKVNINKSIEYLSEYTYANINGKDLIRLLSTKDIYFYEKVLNSNSFGKGNYNYPTRNESTPNEIIDIFKYFAIGNEVLDVGSGNGNVLIGLSENTNIKVADGIEINPRNAFISDIRLSSRNNIKHNIIVDDYLSADILNKYSFITINMPFGLHINNMKRNELKNVKDTSYMFDWVVSPAVSSEWIYVNKALNLLKKGGRIALLTTQTPLFKTADIKQRKDLIDNNLIEYVIDMPAGTYPNTMVSYSLLIINNEKGNSDVKFLNASDCFISQRINRKVDSQKVVHYLTNNEHITTISNQDIIDNDYNLSINYYVDSKNKSKLRNPKMLSDLNVEVSRGFQSFSKDDICTDGKYAIVTISDIDDNGNISKKLSRFNTNKDVEKYKLHKNDILISTKGTKIKTCIIDEVADEDTIYHGNLSLIRVYDIQLDPTYLKLYLDSERGQLELKSIQTGSIIISINSNQLRKINIPLIPIEEQKKIVNNYIFKQKEINVLTTRLSDLKNELTDSINSEFEGENE